MTAETCACGQWPLEEYGPICPSCVIDRVSLSAVASAVWSLWQSANAHDPILAAASCSELNGLVADGYSRRIRDAVRAAGWTYDELRVALEASVSSKWLYESGLLHALDGAFPAESEARWIHEQQEASAAFRPAPWTHADEDAFYGREGRLA